MLLVMLDVNVHSFVDMIPLGTTVYPMKYAHDFVLHHSVFADIVLLSRLIVQRTHLLAFFVKMSAWVTVYASYPTKYIHCF